MDKEMVLLKSDRRAYCYAFFVGGGVFVAQLLLAASSNLGRLTPKSTHLALQALAQGTASLDLALILLGYLLLGWLVHAAPMLLVARILIDLRARGPQVLRPLLHRKGMMSVALAATLMLMIIGNSSAFPLSVPFPNTDLLLSQTASPLLIYGLPLFFSATVAYWLLTLAGPRVRAISLMTSAGICWAWIAPDLPSRPEISRGSQPDLIVIGVDSLRPDHLPEFNYPGPSATPTIDRVVEDSVLFSNAFTPQARTFVAYMSILTGRYPIHHRARENLYPARLVDSKSSIAHLLREQGYTTIMAMDESRFANFDRDYGFDIVASPPPGTVDFIAGSLLDTVGTNLFQLVPGARLLMPHTAGNRAASSIYVPYLHDARVADAIEAAPADKPMFLISHFCIAHSPYVRSSDDSGSTPYPYADSPAKYRNALGVADQQVAHLLEHLRKNGRLKNAIVVLLSDHGEALGLEKDRWVINVPGQQRRSSTYHGHGTPALDESQSKVLLAFQRYRDGRPQWQSRVISEPAVLVDVAPTLLSIKEQGPLPDRTFDGQPLLTAAGESLVTGVRPIFLESGLSGASLQQATIDPRAVANEFSYLYEITPAQRFELLEAELPGQLAMKQRAVIVGRLGLSSWPTGFSEPCWMKVDLDTREATCVPLSSSDPVVSSHKPLLCAHFSRDAVFRSQWCDGMPLLTGQPVTAPKDVTQFHKVGATGPLPAKIGAQLRH